jgi:tetratricopeptide (TPR) repeat protein
MGILMSENLSELVLSALSCYNRGKGAEAEKHFTRILERDPANFEANHLLAVLRAKHARYAEALILMNAALKANPDAAEAWRHRTSILLGMGLPDEAAVSNEKAEALKAKLIPLFEQAKALRNASRLEEALATLDQVLAIGPYNAELWNGRGALLADLHRFEEALAAFDRSLALKPAAPQTLLNRAITLKALGRGEETAEA